MITLIAAVAENGCIGKNGALPWHLPEDLRHFKEKTKGAVVLMGRKTWESLPEQFRPLPKRTNVVVTRQSGYTVPNGVEVFPSIDAALAAHAKDNMMVIGGAEIYRQTIDRANQLFITHVHRMVDGDAYFPKINPEDWNIADRDDRDEYSFVTYRR